MLLARSDARNAIRFATSAGVEGRPIGMPPSESMMILLPSSTPPSAPNRSASDGSLGLNPARRNLFRLALAIRRQGSFCGGLRGRSFRQRQHALDRHDVNDDALPSRYHIGNQLAVEADRGHKLCAIAFTHSTSSRVARPPARPPAGALEPPSICTVMSTRPSAPWRPRPRPRTYPAS